MNPAIARELPVIIGGAGPAGAATAIGLKRAGSAVLAFESRGEIATRARSIYLRSQARDVYEAIAGFDPGRDSTIEFLENTLRQVARDEAVPIEYRMRIVDVVDHADHVAVSVQRAGSDEVRTIRGRLFVDASGGRIPATNTGQLERVPVGRSHVYVTAQYDTPALRRGIYGAFDRQRDEAIFFFPVEDGRGFISYYDLPPGMPMGDEAAVLARYDAVAGRLGLGTPRSTPQAIDAQQHLSISAAEGHVLKISDSAGLADPYLGAGMSAGLVDAATAVRALTTIDDPVLAARAAADDVMAGHRALTWQGQALVDLRPIVMRSLKRAHFDERLQPEDIRRSLVLDAAVGVLSRIPIRGPG